MPSCNLSGLAHASRCTGCSSSNCYLFLLFFFFSPSLSLFHNRMLLHFLLHSSFFLLQFGFFLNLINYTLFYYILQFSHSFALFLLEPTFLAQEYKIHDNTEYHHAKNYMVHPYTDILVLLGFSQWHNLNFETNTVEMLAIKWYSDNMLKTHITSIIRNIFSVHHTGKIQ